MSRTLQKHYARILRRWPTDALRGVTFQDALRRRVADKLSNPTSAPAAASRTGTAQPSTSLPDEKAETEQVNALYSLLENRYSHMYKASDDLLRPAFNPSYYTSLAKEMEEAPTRSWWQKQWLHWSRKVRMK